MADVEKPPQSTQQYNLKWKNYTNNILLTFAEHFTKEKFVDCTLSCEGRFIKAHKLILSSCSPYFQEIFQEHSAPLPVIIINGIKYHIIKQLIDYMYHGEVKVEDADLEELLTIAETLRIKGLCKVRRDNFQKENEDGINPTDADDDCPRGAKKRKQTLCPMPIDLPVIKKEKILPRVKSIEKIESKPIIIKKTLMFHTTDDINSLRESPSTEIIYEDKTVDKDGLKIPRPPNSFMIFANEWRKKLAAQYPNENNKEISVRLGVMWRSLDLTDRAQYYTAAKKLDDEHKSKYPGYYYSPIEARKRKEGKATFIKPRDRRIQPFYAKVITPDDSDELNEDIKEEPEEESLHTELDIPFDDTSLTD